MTPFSEARAAWRAHVKALARCGYYAQARRARVYVAQYVLPAWQTAIGAPTSEELFERFSITPTLERVLHLFGRGVSGVGATREGTPRLTVWPPAAVDGQPVFYRAIPVRDVARIIRASMSSTRHALRRLRPAWPGGTRDQGICAVVSLPSGIYLDGLFDRQLKMPFTLIASEYRFAGAYATRHRDCIGDSLVAQHRWCLRGEGAAANGARVDAGVPDRARQSEASV